MVAFLLVALLLAPQVSPDKSNGRNWRPAVFHGLVVGKSRRTEVLRRLGQPKWSRTHEGNERDRDDRETFNHYESGGEFPGSLTVVLNKKGIVTRADFFPSKLSRDEAVAHFGAGYTVTRYAIEPCGGDEDAETLYESANGPLTYVEYRGRGIAIAIGYQNMVTKISYVSGPIGRSKSRCE